MSGEPAARHRVVIVGGGVGGMWMGGRARGVNAVRKGVGDGVGESKAKDAVKPTCRRARPRDRRPSCHVFEPPLYQVAPRAIAPGGSAQRLRSISRKRMNGADR